MQRTEGCFNLRKTFKPLKYEEVSRRTVVLDEIIKTVIPEEVGKIFVVIKIIPLKVIVSTSTLEG